MTDGGRCDRAETAKPVSTRPSGLKEAVERLQEMADTT